LSYSYTSKKGYLGSSGLVDDLTEKTPLKKVPATSVGNGGSVCPELIDVDSSNRTSVNNI
jgi:hypothetical protein